MTDSTQQPKSSAQPIGDLRRRRRLSSALHCIIGIGALLMNITTRKTGSRPHPIVKVVDIQDGETDPAVWGQNYPREYDRFMMTQNTDTPTAYGGCVKYSKLDRYPAMKRLWNGYAFAVDFNEERGHFYSLIDQKATKRQDCRRAARRVRQLPQRRCARSDQEHGLGGVQSHAL